MTTEPTPLPSLLFEYGEVETYWVFAAGEEAQTLGYELMVKVSTDPDSVDPEPYAVSDDSVPEKVCYPYHYALQKGDTLLWGEPSDDLQTAVNSAFARIGK